MWAKPVSVCELLRDVRLVWQQGRPQAGPQAGTSPLKQPTIPRISVSVLTIIKPSAKCSFITQLSAVQKRGFLCKYYYICRYSFKNSTFGSCWGPVEMPGAGLVGQEDE